MRKSMKIVCGILTTAMLVTGITACGNAKEDTLSEGITTEETANTILAQISAIEGNNISLALAEQPSRPDMSELADEMRRSGVQSEGAGEVPSGEVPAEGWPGRERQRGEVPDGERPNGEFPADGRPAGDALGSDAPDGEIIDDQIPTDGTNGRLSGARPQMWLTLTGETMTIEITDNTIITVNGESATIDDLSADDVVTVIMEGETVNSIISGLGGGGYAP